MARKPATRKDGIVAVSYLVVIALILTVIFYLGHLNIPADRTVRFVMIFGLFTLIGGLFLAIPNCWYANVLSIMNLCCGLTGIFLMYNFRSADMLYLHEAVFCLIFLGQFFDLFDGRAAEHWGSTPKGELFDDVADGTSFGFTIGILIFVSANHKGVGFVAGSLHAVTTLYRLVRFIVEKHKAGVTGGVLHFAGMPSPASAVIMGAYSILLPPLGPLGDVLLLALCALSSALAVSRVQYPHMSRAFFAWVPRRMLWTWFVLGSITMLASTALHIVWVPIAMIAAIVTSYMLSPWLGRMELLGHPTLLAILEACYLRDKNGSRYINSLKRKQEAEKVE